MESKYKEIYLKDSDGDRPERLTLVEAQPTDTVVRAVALGTRQHLAARLLAVPGPAGHRRYTLAALTVGGKRCAKPSLCLPSSRRTGSIGSCLTSWLSDMVRVVRSIGCLLGGWSARLELRLLAQTGYNSCAGFTPHHPPPGAATFQ